MPISVCDCRGAKADLKLPPLMLIVQGVRPEIEHVPVPVSRAAALLGCRAVRWHRASGGSTPALRWVVAFDDGRSAFVKAAANELTAAWLRQEYEVYQSVRADFLAGLIGWCDDGRAPVLILEDLSGAEWPPPWSGEAIRRVLVVLSRVRVVQCAVERSLASTRRLETANWTGIRARPEPFLSLRLCTRWWLDRALPELEAAEGAAGLDGRDLLHGDVQGGNLCLVGDRTVLIDWNWSARGYGMIDVATWLPSLSAEGGPAPDEVIEGEGPLVAVVAGTLAARSTQPAPARMPELRAAQRRKLRHALPWACRVLGIDPPDLL